MLPKTHLSGDMRMLAAALCSVSVAEIAAIAAKPEINSYVLKAPKMFEDWVPPLGAPKEPWRRGRPLR